MIKRVLELSKHARTCLKAGPVPARPTMACGWACFTMSFQLLHVRGAVLAGHLLLVRGQLVAPGGRDQPLAVHHVDLLHSRTFISGYCCCPRPLEQL